MSDATVACRQLGFRGASAVHKKAYYGQGTGRISDTHPNCTGSEDFLKDCDSKYKNVWRESCSHEDDVGVDCLI